MSRGGGQTTVRRRPGQLRHGPLSVLELPARERVLLQAMSQGFLGSIKENQISTIISSHGLPTMVGLVPIVIRSLEHLGLARFHESEHNRLLVLTAKGCELHGLHRLAGIAGSEAHERALSFDHFRISLLGAVCQEPAKTIAEYEQNLSAGRRVHTGVTFKGMEREGLVSINTGARAELQRVEPTAEGLALWQTVGPCLSS